MRNRRSNNANQSSNGGKKKQKKLRRRGKGKKNQNKFTALTNRILRMLQDNTLTDDTEDFQDDVDIFKDLDLVILGSNSDDYNQYAQNAQKEYSSDGDDAYKKDRLKMLKTLLMIPFIYSNQKLRDKYEATARINIKKEIEDLEKI